MLINHDKFKTIPTDGIVRYPLHTETFKIVIGVNAGYTGTNSNTKKPSEIVAPLWQDLAAVAFKETGVYVSATITDTLVTYNTEWGCPVGGEQCALITSTRNPEFCNDSTMYDSVLQEIVNQLKDELQQQTVTIEVINHIDFVYIK